MKQQFLYSKHNNFCDLKQCLVFTSHNLYSYCYYILQKYKILNIDSSDVNENETFVSFEIVDVTCI